METALTPATTAAICKHMNDDHADAIAAYARMFGDIADVLTAEMTALDEHAMDLAVDTVAGRIHTRITFDHVLSDAGDARDTLIRMAQAATPRS